MNTEQDHFDSVQTGFRNFTTTTLREVGGRAPAPSLNQSVNDYRRETLRTLKRTFLPQDHDLYQVNYRGLKTELSRGT